MNDKELRALPGVGKLTARNIVGMRPYRSSEDLFKVKGLGKNRSRNQYCKEKEKERIVTGMKKNKSDFKDRYGKDAEAVMYATATKNAKKNESIKDQLLKMLDEKKQK